jgi:hypothetical protein
MYAENGCSSDVMAADDRVWPSEPNDSPRRDLGACSDLDDGSVGPAGVLVRVGPADAAGTPASGRKGDDVVLASGRASGLSIRDAAALAGLSERHARRRLKEPEVAALVDEARLERRMEIVAGLEQAGPLAVETLIDLLGDRSSSVRHSAARSIVTLGQHAFEKYELETRVVELEELARQIESPKTLPAFKPGWPSQ